MSTGLTCVNLELNWVTRIQIIFYGVLNRGCRGWGGGALGNLEDSNTSVVLQQFVEVFTLNLSHTTPQETRREIRKTTDSETRRCPCRLNPHGHRPHPSASRRSALTG